MRGGTALEQPAGVALHPQPALTGDLAEVRFSFQSRGDRVRGRVLHPPVPPTPALVLLVAPDGSAGHPWLEGAARAWGTWAAVAAIDLPLCGSRASDKLSRAVLADDAPPHPLRSELRDQAAVDLAGTLRLLADDGRADPERVALVACDPLAWLARAYWERFPPRALVLLTREARPAGVEVARCRCIAPPEPSEDPAWLAEAGAFLRERLRA